MAPPPAVPWPFPRRLHSSSSGSCRVLQSLDVLRLQNITPNGKGKTFYSSCAPLGCLNARGLCTAPPMRQ